MHYIFQRQGIPPDEVMAKPPGVRAFMLMSTRMQLEAEWAELERLQGG